MVYIVYFMAYLYISAGVATRLGLPILVAYIQLMFSKIFYQLPWLAKLFIYWFYRYTFCLW